MGSIAEQINFLDKKGDSIPFSAIRKFEIDIAGEVLIKGKANEEDHCAAIKRWNQATQQEAACLENSRSLYTTLTIVVFRRLRRK